MPLLSMQSVSLWFEPGCPVLNDVTLAVEAGDKLAVLGPNGAGKSTLLKLAAGLVKPSSGAVRVHDRDPSLGSPHLTYMAQDLALPLGPSPRELLFALSWYQAEENPAGKDALIELLQLHPYWNRSIAHLSGGQRRLVYLAACLLRQAPILLLDEPTAGLDTDVIELFWRGVTWWIEQESGRSVLLVTHQLANVERFVNRALVVNHGAILEAAPDVLNAARSSTVLEVPQQLESTLVDSRWVSRSSRGQHQWRHPVDRALEARIGPPRGRARRACGGLPNSTRRSERRLCPVDAKGRLRMSAHPLTFGWLRAAGLVARLEFFQYRTNAAFIVLSTLLLPGLAWLTITMQGAKLNDQLVVGLIVFGFVGFSVTTLSQIVHNARRDGVLEFYRSWGVPISAAALGLSVAYFALNAPAVILTLVAGYISAPLAFRPLGLLCSLLCASLCLSLLGILIGFLSRSHSLTRTALVGNLALAFTAFVTPIFGQPEPGSLLYWLGRLNPATFAARALTGSLALPVPYSAIAFNDALLIGLMLVALALLGRVARARWRTTRA